MHKKVKDNTLKEKRCFCTRSVLWEGFVLTCLTSENLGVGTVIIL